MFTDCCLLPSCNPLSDNRTQPQPRHPRANGRWHTQSHPLPSTPVSALHHQPLYFRVFCFVFGCCCYCFVFYFLPIFLAWFCTFLPFETLIDNLISLPKETNAHQGLSPPPVSCLHPFSLLVRVSSEDLTITSVLQKCLNISLRPLWIFFSSRKHK